MLLGFGLYLPNLRSYSQLPSATPTYGPHRCCCAACFAVPKGPSSENYYNYRCSCAAARAQPQTPLLPKVRGHHQTKLEVVGLGVDTNFLFRFSFIYGYQLPIYLDCAATYGSVAYNYGVRGQVPSAPYGRTTIIMGFYLQFLLAVSSSPTCPCFATCGLAACFAGAAGTGSAADEVR